MQNLEPTGHEQVATTRHYHEPVNPHESTRGINALITFFILGFLALVGVGAIAARQTLVQAGILFFYGAIVLIPLIVAVIVLYLAGNKWYMDKQKRKQAALDVEAKEKQVNDESRLVQAEAKRREAEAERIRLLIPFDEQGNAAIRDPDTQRIIQLTGNMRAHPNLTTLHLTNKQEGLKGPTDMQALPPGNIAKPTIEEIVSQIARNSYEICLGRSLQSSEYIKAQLPDSHLKLIGGTRMGKSCEAAAILKQLSKTHDRGHLLFALLDLENKTSRLFADDPHVMMVDTGMKKIKMHARTVEQVAHYLIILHEMMNWRYTLTDAQLAQLPAILVYIEEFLYWKRVLANFVDKETREQAMMAFAGLATRGLKTKIHLMCCAQVDYRDDELVEAMAQFIGVNVAFSVKPDAARAAGFVSSELLKQNYAARIPGQFVVEQTGGADLGVAPEFDVRSQLALLEEGRTVVTEESTSQLQPDHNPTRNQIEPALQAKVHQIMENSGETMAETIKRVWGVSPSGNSPKYEKAKAEYMQCQGYIHTLARQSMKGEA